MPDQFHKQHEPEEVNPLKKYFREPGLYIKLPTKGYFYDEGDIEFSVTGELPVFPMTAYDEIYVNNPDALLNGDAMEKVIRSCAPAVRNVRNLSIPDFDAIILAIRASSYGDEMELTTHCPACGKEQSFSASIRYSLETCAFHEREYPVKLREGLIVYVKPRTYASNTKIALLAFEQAKLAQSLQAADVSEIEKNQAFRDSFEKVARLNYDMIADSVMAVQIPTGIVTDRDHIDEFIKNIDTKSADRLDDMITAITNIGITKKQDIICQACEHEWTTPISFDPAHFFG